MLNPSEDIKINRFRLDEEAASISSLIYEYDRKWCDAFSRLEKLNSQIENLNDELKILRMDLFFKAKSGDGKLSDKMAEAIAFSSKEYIEKFQDLKQKREERSGALTNEQLYKSMHYVLLDKSRQIDLLWKMFSAQYFTTDLSGGEKTKNSSNAIGEFAEKMTTRPTRREK